MKLILQAIKSLFRGVNGKIQSTADILQNYMDEAVKTLTSDLSKKMDKTDPTGTGSFSMNRKAGSAIGKNSVAIGNKCIASDTSSYAEGEQNTASGPRSHAEGWGCIASSNSAHAEGITTSADGEAAHAEGGFNWANGDYSHAEGYRNFAEADFSHVQGKCCIKDSEKKYAHIVGNGTAPEARSNAHTLDWNGVGWYAGGLQVGGTGQDSEDAKNVLLDGEIDWNATEGEPGHILNRTHWTDEDGTVHKLDNKYIDAEWMATLAEQIDAYIDGEVVTSVPGSYATIDGFPADVAQTGNEFVVYYDSYDTFYRCTAKSVSRVGYIIGNSSLVKDSLEDTGEPFAFLVTPLSATGWRFYSIDESATDHVIAIGKVNKLPVPMPEEYLPESVDGVVIRSSTADSTKLFKLTVDDSGTITATEVT